MLCSFSLQFIFFSEQPFYGNYSTSDSHTNTVISHAFAYSSRWRRKLWQGLLLYTFYHYLEYHVCHDQIQSCVPFHVPVHHKVPGYMYFDPAFSTEIHKTNYGLQFVQALGFFYSFNWDSRVCNFLEGCIALMTWKGLKRPKFNFLVQLSELQNLPCSNRKSYLSRFLQQYGKFFWKSREYTFQNKIFHFIATHNISRKKKQTFVFNKIMQSFWLKKQFLQRNVWLEEKG